MEKTEHQWQCTKCGRQRTTNDGVYDRIHHICCGSAYNLELVLPYRPVLKNLSIQMAVLV